MSSSRLREIATLPAAELTDKPWLSKMPSAGQMVLWFSSVVSFASLACGLVALSIPFFYREGHVSVKGTYMADTMEVRYGGKSGPYGIVHEDSRQEYLLAIFDSLERQVATVSSLRLPQENTSVLYLPFRPVIYVFSEDFSYSSYAYFSLGAFLVAISVFWSGRRSAASYSSRKGA